MPAPPRRRPGPFVLAPLDTLALRQVGIVSTVALMGMAMTEHQAAFFVVRGSPRPFDGEYASRRTLVAHHLGSAW